MSTVTSTTAKKALLLEVTVEPRPQSTSRVVPFWLVLCYPHVHDFTVALTAREIGLITTIMVLAQTRPGGFGWLEPDDTQSRGWPSLAHAARDRVEVQS